MCDDMLQKKQGFFKNWIISCFPLHSFYQVPCGKQVGKLNCTAGFTLTIIATDKIKRQDRHSNLQSTTHARNSTNPINSSFKISTMSTYFYFFCKLNDNMINIMDRQVEEGRAAQSAPSKKSAIIILFAHLFFLFTKTLLSCSQHW